MLTDFHGENTLREEIGWALLALVCGTVLINMIKTAVVSYSVVKRSLILGYKKLRSLVRPSPPSTIAIKPEIVKQTMMTEGAGNLSNYTLAVNNSISSTVCLTNLGRMEIDAIPSKIKFENITPNQSNHFKAHQMLTR
jgi:hypothetical protein